LKRTWHHIIREENFLSLAGNALIALFGVGGFALLARSLQPHDFGSWILFLTAGSFLEMFRFGITSTGLIRFLSGAGTVERRQLIGANALIGAVATLILVVLLFAIRMIFDRAISGSALALFFTWYPPLAILNLPWNNALVLLQADRSYGKILFLKVINSGGFFLILLTSHLYFKFNLRSLTIALLLVNGFTSLIAILRGWDGWADLGSATRRHVNDLFSFGKYTMFTLIGTNLLRSADTFILGISPLGNAAVALYAIPLKLTELQQIPLRSFTATAFPKMSKASLEGRNEQARDLFYTYTGALTILFAMISMITFFFAEYLVLILAGRAYTVIDPTTGFDAVSILRIFSIYGLLLPLDRMTGIFLDSINRPGQNAVKVFFMVAANVVGDFIAVFHFQSLIWMAIGSVLFTIIGIVAGMHFMNRETPIQYGRLWSDGICFYSTLFRQMVRGWRAPTATAVQSLSK
jgi:O-antigen/teichoic acid export membrane protein